MGQVFAAPCTQPVAEIGIRKTDTSLNVIFSKLAKNYFEADNLSDSTHAVKCYSLFSYMQTDAHQYMTMDEWNSLVLLPLANLQTECNRRRLALYEEVEKSGFLTRSTVWGFKMFVPLRRFRAQGSDLLVALCMIPTFLACYLAVLLGLLVDLVTCHSLGRYVTPNYYRERFHTLIATHPEYDTAVIDREIKTFLETATAHLNQHLQGRLFVYVYIGNDYTGVGRSIRTDNYFYLRFYQPPTPTRALTIPPTPTLISSLGGPSQPIMSKGIMGAGQPIVIPVGAHPLPPQLPQAVLIATLDKHTV